MLSLLANKTDIIYFAMDNMAHLDDSALISLTLAGDEKAFEVLVRRYQRLVYNVLYQMTYSHEQASDLTQETFLKTYKSLARFHRSAKFKPWLLKIATNSALNFIRSQKPQASLEQLLEDDPTLEPIASDNVEENIARKFDQRQLQEALGKLSIRHRQMFVLRYQFDLAYEDIAEITGEPKTTIKSLLFRIREKLRSLLLGGIQGKV